MECRDVRILRLRQLVQLKMLTIIPRSTVGEPAVKPPKIKTKGLAFGKFTTRKIMFVIEGTEKELALQYSKFKWWQHTFYRNIKNVEYMGMQGEFAAPSEKFPKGRPHLQCCVIAKHSKLIGTVALLKQLQPLIPAGLQCEKGKASIAKIIHYTSKPHDGCDCDHCVKARLCKPNWGEYIESGMRPVGQGKKFAMLEADLKSGATRDSIIDDYMQMYLRYGNNIEKLITHFRQKAKFAAAQNPMQPWDPEMWMILEAARSFLPKPRRTIVWIWSKKLRTNKTTFLQWLTWLHNFNAISEIWSWPNMVMMYRDQRLLTYNFPKMTDWESKETKRALCFLERLDDGGFCCTGKYQGGADIIANSHIYVTANAPPPLCWEPSDPDTRVRTICLDPLILKRKLNLAYNNEAASIDGYRCIQAPKRRRQIKKAPDVLRLDAPQIEPVLLVEDDLPDFLDMEALDQALQNGICD